MFGQCPECGHLKDPEAAVRPPRFIARGSSADEGWWMSGPVLTLFAMVPGTVVLAVGLSVDSLFLQGIGAFLVAVPLVLGFGLSGW